MFISLIFPCHNEEQAIPQFLPQVLQTKTNLLQQGLITDLEILVIDDGSTDRSRELLEKYQGQICLIPFTLQKGYGTAIQEGIRQAKGDWIAFCDLDNTCDLADLKRMIELTKAGSQPATQNSRLQTVWGNRLHKKSQMSLIRKIGNSLYQAIFLFLTFRFVPDPCSGFRLFQKSAFIPQIYKLPKDLSFALAFTAYCVRHYIPFVTIDITYQKRLGKSNLHWLKDGFVFLINLIQFLFLKKI